MYEAAAGTVTDALTAASPETFSADTIAAILALTTGSGDSSVQLSQVTALPTGEVTVASGTEIIYIAAEPGVEVIGPQNVPVVMFQGTAGVTARFTGSGAGSEAGTADRLVVGTAGADRIRIDDEKNSHITAGAGDTIVAGAGSDTIVAGMGDSTVSGGSGYAIVDLGGDASDYTISVVDGKAVVTGNGSTTTMDGIQYVSLDDKDALIFANDSVEAAVSILYETTFGRAADPYGLDFWFDRAREGISLNAIAEGFVNSDEYKALAQVDNATFVNNLFVQTFGKNATEAELAEWTAKLSNGFDRADLIESFAAIAGNMVADGSGSEVVGSVTIIPGTFG